MTTTTPQFDVAVIGAGITGLATASLLRRLGKRVLVLEARDTPGGSIRTYRQNGWLVEEGPNTLQVADAATEDTLESLGLLDPAIESQPGAKKRFLVHRSKLQPVPMGPISFLTSPLFTWRTRWRIFREPWTRSPTPPPEDESLADFVRRRLGQDFLERIINPFVGGVYAGKPEELSVIHGFPKLYKLEAMHGSLIRGTLAKRKATKESGRKIRTRLLSYPGGLEKCINILATHLPDLHCGSIVQTLECVDAGWSIHWHDREGNSQRTTARNLVCALPADALADLPLPPETNRHLEILREVVYPPVTSVSLGFPRDGVAHPLDGFGCLIPPHEPFQILGTLFSSTLFPGRAPPGHVLLTSFVGGTRAPDLALKSDAEIVELVTSDLARLVGVQGTPVFTHIARWPKAIPQYKVGYRRFLDAIQQAEASCPGLLIGGHVRDGISLSYCLASAARMAQIIGSQETLP